MLHLIVNWLISASGLVIAAYIIPGFEVRDFKSALIAALVIGLINATIGLILKILTLPISVLTFGLFLLVINALMLMLASKFVPGFTVNGFLPAFLGAVVLAIVSTIVRSLVFSG